VKCRLGLLYRLVWLLPMLVFGCAEARFPKDGFRQASSPANSTLSATPTELVGLERDGIQSLLGEPQLIRRDGPAEVWQYTAYTCILNLFLYEVSKTYRVKYVELNTQLGETFSQKHCYKKLRQVKKKSPA